jgi:hypothetical protein
MSFHSTSANLLNGAAGLLGAVVAWTSSQLNDIGFYSEKVAQIGGTVVVALTIFNGYLMARKNWRDRNK